MASLDDAVSTLKGVSTNLSQIWLTIKTIFPQSTGTSFAATAGTATLPAQPNGFIIVNLPSGTQAKVPYYLP
jgi:hypothetical protein